MVGINLLSWRDDNVPEVSLVAILDKNRKEGFLRNERGLICDHRSCSLYSEVMGSSVRRLFMTQSMQKPSMKQPVVGKSRWLIMKSMALSHKLSRRKSVTISVTKAVQGRGYEVDITQSQPSRALGNWSKTARSNVRSVVEVLDFELAKRKSAIWCWSQGLD